MLQSHMVCAMCVRARMRNDKREKERIWFMVVCVKCQRRIGILRNVIAALAIWRR